MTVLDIPGPSNPLGTLVRSKTQSVFGHFDNSINLFIFCSFRSFWAYEALNRSVVGKIPFIFSIPIKVDGRKSLQHDMVSKFNVPSFDSSTGLWSRCIHVIWHQNGTTVRKLSRNGTRLSSYIFLT